MLTSTHRRRAEGERPVFRRAVSSPDTPRPSAAVSWPALDYALKAQRIADEVLRQLPEPVFTVIRASYVDWIVPPSRLPNAVHALAERDLADLLRRPPSFAATEFRGRWAVAGFAAGLVASGVATRFSGSSLLMSVALACAVGTAVALMGSWASEHFATARHNKTMRRKHAEARERVAHEQQTPEWREAIAAAERQRDAEREAHEQAAWQAASLRGTLGLANLGGLPDLFRRSSSNEAAVAWACMRPLRERIEMTRDYFSEDAAALFGAWKLVAEEIWDDLPPEYGAAVAVARGELDKAALIVTELTDRPTEAALVAQGILAYLAKNPLVGSEENRVALKVECLAALHRRS